MIYKRIIRVIGKDSGFTLLELLVVLTIMGLIFAMSVPRLAGSIGSTTLKTAAADTTSVFRYARNQAVVSGKTVECKIGPDRKKITMRFHQSEDGIEDEPQFYKVYPAPDGIEISAAEELERYGDQEFSTFLFYPDGSSSGGEVIIIDNETENQFVCRIDFITGMVSIEDQEQ